MARIDPRIASRFDQESNSSNVKFVIATIPLAIVLLFFVFEAYSRPDKPFYNLPSYITDDATIKAAAEASGSLVPLMDMCYVVLSFCVFWACFTGYLLGFLRARHAMIETFLDEGKSVLGNVVYEGRCWAFEFRYYGYVSYALPEPLDGGADGEEEEEEETTTKKKSRKKKNKMGGHGTMVHKKIRIYEPYTRELVPILYLPGYPMSGQGKDDLEYANLLAVKNRPREVFLGRFCLLWTITCALVTVYILHQMGVIDEAEYYAGIKDDYENVHKGWMLFGLFMGVGVLGVAVGGNVLSWLWRRWWLLHQGSLSDGELSMHGVNGSGSQSQSQSVEDYHRMAYT